MNTTATDFTTDVWRRVDSKDAASFAELFAPEGKLTFANGEPMVGPEEIRAGVAGFFNTIESLRHTVVNEWTTEDDSIIELNVHYDRLDGGHADIPVVTIWTRNSDGLFTSYRVFFDLTPVFA
jgi:ketosteroid isomerase-like protein